MKSLFLLALAFAGVSLADDKDDWPRIEIESPNADLKLKVVCETSDASPLWHQILTAADEIDEYKNQESGCSNDNGVESKCTKVEEDPDEGARISLCGSQQATNCAIVSALARGIVDKCADGGDRAGGWGEWEYKENGDWVDGGSTVSIERRF